MRSASSRGALAAVCAFLLWGLFPLYWKALKSVSPGELLCHRIVWSAAFVAVALALSRRFREVAAVFRNRRGVAVLLTSSLVISGNWFLYIWAVNAGHVVECSLGYYINPLVNALLGVVFLRDRLRPLQIAAIGLAAFGVAVSVAGYGEFPWISLTLAVSFGFYGLLRKVAAVESLPGLFFETALLTIPGAVYLVFLEVTGEAAFGHADFRINALLVGAGLATSLPLVLFAYAARRITLPALGVAQYIAPTCMFILGVWLYGEPLGTTGILTFAFIWAGVLLYVGEGLHFMRRAAGLGRA